MLAMYPKQPFDFAGRTGTVSFDISNDSHGTHAAWPEFWLSNLPFPHRLITSIVAGTSGTWFRDSFSAALPPANMDFARTVTIWTSGAGLSIQLS